MPKPALPPPPPVGDPVIPPPEPTFLDVTWAKIKAIGKWLARVFVSPGVAVLVVIGAILLVVLGFKNIQIGGLLGRLFGKKSPSSKAIAVANSVPKDRVGADGKIIPQGQPDSKGMTQAVVVPIKDPGIFSNPDTVVFTPPGETKPIEIQLPDGVKAKDVEQVIVVKPKEFVVSVKDKSGKVDVDALLNKYNR